MWVKFKSQFFNFKSNIFLSHKFVNNTLYQNNPSSSLFFPLTKANIKFPRLEKQRLKRRRVSRVFGLIKKIRIKFFLFEIALLSFFFKSYIYNQIHLFFHCSSYLINDYTKLLNLLFNQFYLKNWLKLFFLKMVRIGVRLNLKKTKINSNNYKIYMFNNFFRFKSILGNVSRFYFSLNLLTIKIININLLFLNLSKFKNNKFFYNNSKIYYFFFILLMLLNNNINKIKKILISNFIYKTLK